MFTTEFTTRKLMLAVGVHSTSGLTRNECLVFERIFNERLNRSDCGCAHAHSLRCDGESLKSGAIAMMRIVPTLVT